MQTRCPPGLIFTSALVVALAAFSRVLVAGAGVGGDGTWSLMPGLVVTRQDHASIYDAEGDRMIVWGGTLLANQAQGDILYPLGASDDLAEVTFSGTPAWRALVPVGERPAPRSSHTLVLDRPRRTAILFGGAGPGGVYADVWRLDLSGAPKWTRLDPTGPGPGARWGHTAIHDAAGNRMIVFGGFDADATPLDDVWALDLSGSPAWTQLTPAGPGPSPRGNHVAIYDSRQRRMIVMGGYDSFGRNDVWSLPLATAGAWSQLFPVGDRPAQVGEHAAVYDSVRNAMVIVGRLSNLAANPPVFRLSLGTTPVWSSVTATGSVPAAFERQSLIVDVARDRIVLFGARESIWTQPMVGGSWVSTPLANTLPTRRQSDDTPMSIFDVKRNRILLAFTGRSDDTLRLWSLALAPEPRWSRVPTTGPAPMERLGPSWCIDTRRDRLIMYGGTSSQSSAYASQIWTLDLAAPQWTTASPPGPTGRWHHSAVYDSLADRMIVFGGWSFVAGHLNDLWSYAPASGTWSALAASGEVPPRLGHAAVLDDSRRRMVIYGGVGRDFVLMDDVWYLDLDPAPAWAPVSSFGLTPQHQHHQLLHDPVRDRMIAYGRYGAAPFQFGSVYAMSFSPVPAWRRLLSDGQAPHPGTVAAVYDPLADRLVAVGRATYALEFDAVPAPALALREQAAAPDRVTFRFAVHDANGMAVVLWRRAMGESDWTEVESVTVNGESVTVEDLRPTPGTAYLYRPGLRDEGGEQPFESIPVEVPAVSRAAIGTLWPNPTGGRLAARLLVPGAAEVQVELLDLNGRRVFSDVWRAGRAGALERRLDLPASLAPGVYVFRMSVGSSSDTRRITVLH